VNINSIKKFIEKTWDDSAIPALKEYICLPAVSPFFAKDWNKTGNLMDAVKLARSWCNDMKLENSTTRIIADDKRTPILLIEIAATNSENQDTTLFYGHLDKQPPGKGWDENKGPWTPVIENNRLYGRGSADDGYAVFTAVTAIKALQTHNIPHGRCVILIETCEESGSFDLEYYIEKYKQNITIPKLIICLDSSCGDYKRLWITTSLRGSVVCELEARILTQNIHSGSSGMAASSFRILRQVLDRIEDSKTGQLLLPEFYGQIPNKRLDQIEKIAKILGEKIVSDIPLVNGAVPMSHDHAELILNSTWKPMVSYIGVQGIPPIDGAVNALRESTKLLLSIRTPPNVEAILAAKALQKLLEQDPPYGAKVSVKLSKYAKGWQMPEMGNTLKKRVNESSAMCFNEETAYSGEGGSIPFMALLSEKFPTSKFIITGVLGPQANAHGPNEFLHIPYVKKLTLAIANVLG
jgi:acetylornithine deacetylase/succinyl-diaminopimelate desuccinylase-like protein